MSDDLTKTLIQRLEEYFEAEIAEGYQVVDRESCLRLRKMAMTELKLKKGNWGYTGKALDEILKEKNISVVDQNPSSTIGNLKFNVPTPAQAAPPTQPAAPTPPLQDSMGQTQQKEVKKILDPSVEKANQETLRGAFSLVGEAYSALGIIGGKKIELKEMTREEFDKKAGEYADRAGSFAYRHNLEIPWLIEILSLVGTGCILFLVPLINVLYLKTEKAKELGKDTEKEHGFLPPES
ncbi:MAG: hypothetical protein ACRD9Q_06035 [Nitrososphaeraceae archaeon]